MTALANPTPNTKITLSGQYNAFIWKRVLLLGVLVIALVLSLITDISTGPAQLGLLDVL